jgi:hypothetical protein
LFLKLFQSFIIFTHYNVWLVIIISFVYVKKKYYHYYLIQYLILFLSLYNIILNCCTCIMVFINIRIGIWCTMWCYVHNTIMFDNICVPTIHICISIKCQCGFKNFNRVTYTTVKRNILLASLRSFLLFLFQSKKYPNG